MTLSVHIVGAGPAGCATALSLQKRANELGRDLTVSLVIPSAKGQPAIGETIPPAASERLSELGLTHVLNEVHLECPGSVSIWGSEEPGYNDFLFTPVGKGYHLNRNHFNNQLLDACELAGIQLINESKVVDVAFFDGYCELVLQNSGQSKVLHSNFVVDATGIQAYIARNLGVVRNEYDSVISLCAFYDLPPSNCKPEHTLVSTDENGWWYASRLPGDKGLISLCTDTQTLKQKRLNEPENWLNSFEKTGWLHKACKDQFQTAFALPAQLHTRVAPSAILSNCVGKHWLAVGDAASSYDSMTSAGITKALDHGLRAGQAIASQLLLNNQRDIEAYQQRVFDDFNQYLCLHQQLYSAEERYVGAGFWQRRQLS